MKAFEVLAASAAAVLTLSSAVASAKPNTVPSFLKSVQTLSKMPRKVAGTKAKRADCVNLAGNWKGTCTDSDNSTYDSEWILDQDDCSEVSLGDTNLPMGGVAELGSTSAQNYWHATAFGDWNAAGNILKLRVSYNGRDLGTDSFYYSGFGTEDLQIVNGQLVTRSIQTSSFEVGGQHGQQEYWEACTYDKQPSSK